VRLGDDQILQRLRTSWEADGLRLFQWNWSDSKIQLTFSVTLEVSPMSLASRAKGRLQDALRKAQASQKFSRKLSVRSVGKNTTVQVQDYIKSRVKKELFVDPVFAEKMQQLILVNPQVDPSRPASSGRGMFPYMIGHRLWDRQHLCGHVLATLDGCRGASSADA